MLLTLSQYQIKIQWCSPQVLIAGRNYMLRYADQHISVFITAIKYRLNTETGEHLSAKSIRAGEICVANVIIKQLPGGDISLDSSTQLEMFDLETGSTVATVEFEFELRRATNIRWQTLSVDKTARALHKKQKPICLWFTGLSGSGKSTIANLLEKRLFEAKKHTYLLDGDNVRHGLNRDLGFTESDRVENIRRVAEVAKLMVDAGLIVIASFISPFQADRKMARQLFAEGEFIEVFVDTPLAECEKRDVKGLYAKARRGELKNFTGIDSAYERPEQPELRLDTCQMSAETCVEKIIHSVLKLNSDN